MLCLQPFKAQALCFHACSSLVAELPGDLIPNTPKLPTPLQSSCAVFIFYPIKTGQLKSNRCTAFRGAGIQLCSCVIEHTVLNRLLSRFLLGVLFMQDGIFKVAKDFLLLSLSFLFLHIAHPKLSSVSFLFEPLGVPHSKIFSFD